jgi:hypothetical protein
MNDLTKEDWLERCKAELIRLGPDFTDLEASDLAQILFDIEGESCMPSDTPEEAAASELDAWGE